MKRLMLILLLLSFLFVLGCGAQPVEEPLTFVVVPDESTETMHRRWESFIDYIGEQVGREAELMISTDYAAAVEAMKYGHADVGYFGPFGYLFVAEEAEVDVMVIEVNEAVNSAVCRAFILVRDDSDIETMDDLNGRTFGFVDIGSTSGYLFPHYGLTLNNVELGETFFAGNHPAAIMSVKNGTVDACGTSEYKIAAAIEEGIVGEDELRVLWESPAYPGCTWVVLSSLDPELKQALTDAFVNMPPGTILKPGVSGYIPATDSDYDFIRDVQELVGD